MQQTGTLRKRRKRNLTKVPGLGLIPYDADKDVLEDYYASKTFDATKNRDVNVNRQKGANSHTKINIDIPNSVPEESDSDPENEYQDIEDGLKTVGDGSGPPKDFKKDNELPYMLSKRTATRMRNLIILGSTSGAFPWKWNWKTYKLEEWSPKNVQLWWYFWVVYTIQTTFLTVFQVHAFGESISLAKQTKSYRKAFQASFSFYWYCYAVYFNINLYYYKDAIRQYINTMFEMNRKFVERYVITMKGYKQSGCILIDLAIPTNTCQVFVCVALFCGMPYQPWFLQHYIYTPEQPWWYRIPGAIHEYILIGQVITSYMFNSWIIFAHTNTVRFWLQEIHCNNETQYTTNEIRTRRNAMQVFQSLQILCTLFNDCMSPMAVPAVKIHVASVLVPCGYVLINSMSSVFLEEFPGVLTYPFGIIDTITAGFVILSMSAEMFDLSVSFVDSWSRTKHKDFRRLLKSFPTLKVRVGRYYFITISTTITYFRVTTDYIIDCIITF